MFLLVGGTVVALGLAGRRMFSPACPRCRARDWDRRLCKPLVTCRRCATRVDAQGRLYN